MTSSLRVLVVSLRWKISSCRLRLTLAMLMYTPITSISHSSMPVSNFRHIECNPRHSHFNGDPSMIDDVERGRPTRAVDDIKVEYHKSSGRPTVVYPFEDYKATQKEVSPEFLNSRPWEHFGTRLNFDFAEFAQEAHLSQQHVSRLFDVVAKIMEKPADFTLRTKVDLEQAWRKAELRHPAV